MRRRIFGVMTASGIDTAKSAKTMTNGFRPPLTKTFGTGARLGPVLF
jgi:hypothetical protein